jgi:hypothetical protein
LNEVGVIPVNKIGSFRGSFRLEVEFVCFDNLQWPIIVSISSFGISIAQPGDDA